MGGASASKNVLIAVDGSDFSYNAFNWYFKNNVNAKSDHHILHHTLCPGSLSAGSQFVGILPLDQDGLTRQLENLKTEAKRLEKDLMKKCAQLNFRCEWHTSVGDPGSSILGAVNKYNVSLVVMGTRGLNTLRRTIMGSVSDYVLHHSHVPVLVIPSVMDDKEPAKGA